MTLSRPTLRELFGVRGGEDLVAAAEASVRAIGDWCAPRASTPGTTPRRT